MRAELRSLELIVAFAQANTSILASVQKKCNHEVWQPLSIFCPHAEELGCQNIDSIQSRDVSADKRNTKK